MPRRNTSVRLTDRELKLLETAARLRGTPTSTLIRRLALSGASTLVEQELDDLRPSESVDVPVGTGGGDG